MSKKIMCKLGFHKWDKVIYEILNTRFKEVRRCLNCGIEQYKSKTYRHWIVIDGDDIRREINTLQFLKDIDSPNKDNPL
jgi:hypothetical protein